MAGLDEVESGSAEPAPTEPDAKMAGGVPGGFAKFVQGGNGVFEIQSGTFLGLVQQSAESGQVVFLQASHRSFHPVGLANDVQGPAIN